MWKRKLGLGTMHGLGLTDQEQIRLFSEVGFDAFFTGWSQDAPIAQWNTTGKECGMLYQSIHAPFGGAADMWGDDAEKGKIALEELILCLRDCAKNEVPIMIAHTFIGFKDHMPTEIGLERFGALVKEAEKIGVTIAFENTEGEEYLAALMENFGESSAVGFCWDSGHEMCYNHSQDMLARYGKSLIATHLNDNLGISRYDGEIFWTDDLHLLPFDGIADWRYNMERVRKTGFSDILTFELTVSSKPGRHENDGYAKLSAVEYITECYKRACRVAALL